MVAEDRFRGSVAPRELRAACARTSPWLRAGGSPDLVLRLAAAAVLAAGLSCSNGQNAEQAQPVSREQALQTLQKAAEFYRTQVAKEGGYHFRYAADLSFGRSEQASGLSQVTVQRGGTPLVGMAYLTAYEATGDDYYLQAARDAAHALVKGQHCSGGWDYIIEFDPAKRPQYNYRADGGCGPGYQPSGDGDRRPRYTTLDDNVTQAAVRLLMRVDRELNFKDEKIHEAVEYALNSLMRVQYPNGAWPQRYYEFSDPKQFPVKRASYPESWSRTWPGPDYRGHYTFNDNSIVDMIDTMLEAARIYNEPKYQASAEKGGDFILLAQMPDPQPGWAQQYDRDMHPAWARIFEPPSVTGGESQGVMQGLLVLYRETGNKKYLEPLPRALEYYRNSVLPEVENPSEARRRSCPPGSVCMARFYELKTNKPLYITKGSRVRAAQLGSAMLDGYEISYTDESVITHYGVITGGDEFEEIAQEYERVAAADPATLKRPDKLRGLSPWQGQPPPPELGPELTARVQAAINEIDERGAWLQPGTIGKADQIASVFAAEDMVVTIGDDTYPLRENDTLQVFRGEKPPVEQTISSQAFARNVEALSAYIAATQP